MEPLDTLGGTIWGQLSCRFFRGSIFKIFNIPPYLETEQMYMPISPISFFPALLRYE